MAVATPPRVRRTGGPDAPRPPPVTDRPARRDQRRRCRRISRRPVPGLRRHRSGHHHRLRCTAARSGRAGPAATRGAVRRQPPLGVERARDVGPPGGRARAGRGRGGRGRAPGHGPLPGRHHREHVRLHPRGGPTAGTRLPDRGRVRRRPVRAGRLDVRAGRESALRRHDRRRDDGDGADHQRVGESGRGLRGVHERAGRNESERRHRLGRDPGGQRASGAVRDQRLGGRQRAVPAEPAVLALT